MTTACSALAPYHLTADAIARYRTDGFVATPGLLSVEEAADLRERYLAASGNAKQHGDGRIFRQFVNLWRGDSSLLDLALHPRMCQVATALAGEPLRLWHDHLLVKSPHNGAPTEFHQDQPYWPHRDAPHPLSAWVALVDVPPQRGCMSYLPGSQHLTDLQAQNLADAGSLFALRPELAWQPFVTVPARAGDVIWHHGRTAHRANANDTAEDRVVVSVIYMPRTTRLSGAGHVCTDGSAYRAGDLLDGPEFPEV
jgi:ectoine hydroxylase-related dioxygenase (phytanoyl-CoA dioxygenase family)